MANAARQDVFAATDTGEQAKDVSGNNDFGAQVACRQAKGNLTKWARDGGGREENR